MSYKTRTTYLAFVFFANFLSWSDLNAQTRFNYPQTPVYPVLDTIFGTVITDNYRWLEDLNSQRVKDWLKLQADYTDNRFDY